VVVCRVVPTTQEYLFQVLRHVYLDMRP
jgi:hypothetical protein